MSKTKGVKAAYIHPQYIEHMVYVDRPRAGAFYQVKKNDSLSKIANKAYGRGTKKYWGMINLSAYNSRFTRRKKSTKCKAPLRQYPDGYIALCRPYPVLWIPPKEGGEPRPGIKPKTVPKTKPIGPLVGPLIKPNSTIKSKPLPVTVASAFSSKKTPARASVATAARVAAATTTKVREEMFPQLEPEPKEGLPSWVVPVAVFGIGVIGIAFAAKVGD